MSPLTNFVTVYAFSPKLQHIGTHMFLTGNILRNLITALEFPQLKWSLIYGNTKNIDFHHSLRNFKTMVSTEIKL